MSRIATKGIDYTSKDYEAFRTMMIAKLQEKMPEYTDHRQTDAGIVILELNAMGLDIISMYQDNIANEVFLETAQQKENIDIWCRMLGYSPVPATPSKAKQVFVLSAVQATDTVIPKGTIVKTSGTSVEPEVKFETSASLTIPAGKLGNETSNGEYLYQADVVQGYTVSNEIVGSSSGLADQSFSLSYSPVIVDSIQLYINEGTGFSLWTKVDTFMDSEKDSKHFTVTVGANNVANVTFGNGVFGKIPKALANNIKSTYRVGGGEQGNVGANKITTMGTNLALVRSTFNPEVPYEYGAEKETNDAIRISAPVASRTMWGALTVDDFAKVVKSNFPTVLKAVAKRDETDINDIHIYMLLAGNANLPADLQTEIQDFFDDNLGGRKIVGVHEIFLHSATLVPLTLVATLVVDDLYSRSNIQSAITSYITNYLAVGNYPFNQYLSLSKLASEIMSGENAIAGIKSLVFTTPATDIQTPAVSEIYTLGTLTLNASGGVE